MKVNINTLLTAAAILAPLALNAQETNSTAAVASPEKEKAADGITIAVPDTKKATIKVSGYAQAQYYYSDSKGNSGDPYSGFAIRRAAISVSGKIDDNWSAEVGFEIDSGGSGGKLTDAFVDKAIISYSCDLGKLTAGYQKTAFVMEEYSSSKTALAIEHSIASRYFTQASGFKQLTGRHGGIWWNGKVGDFKYTLAVANQYKEDFSGDSNDGVAFFGTLAYAFKTDDGVDIELGVNGAYNPGNDSKDADGNYTSDAPHGAVYGVEPYAKVKLDGFTGILSVIYADGDEDAGIKDSAYSINATAAYRFENDIEPVVRLAYVDVGDNENLGPKMLQNTPAGTSDHDSAFGVYVGANFYANKNIKISAGYEYTSFDGGAKSEDANALRVQLQATF